MTRGRVNGRRRAVLALPPVVGALLAALLVLLPSPATASGATALPGAAAPSDTTAPPDTITPSASATAPDSTPDSPSAAPTTPPPPPPDNPAAQRPHPHTTQGSQPGRSHPTRTPRPVSVQLRTVPALPTVRFSIDGRIFTAGPDGAVTVTLDHDFTQHTLALLTPALTAAGHRFAFYRWQGQRDPDQAYRTVVTGLPWRAPYAITAAFAEQCPVTPAFTDQHGAALDVSTLTPATVRSDTGQISTLAVLGTSWLTCEIPVYVDGSVTTRPLGYRLQSLMAAGTNIVDAGKQSFAPDTDPRPTFVGLYFNLAVTAHDAFFGAAAGSHAVLVGPDHHLHTLDFTAAHTATFAHLPRGDYTLTVTGASGVALTKPIRLSRDSSTDLTVVTGADLGSTAAAGGVFAVMLPLVARHRRDWLRRLLRREAKEALDL